jgi:hypothetical protein
MASTPTVEERRRWAWEQLAAGRSTSRLAAELAERYGVGRRTAHRDVGEAYKRFREDLELPELDKPAMIARLVSILEDSLEKSARTNNAGATVAATRVLIDLLGLNPEG